MICFSLLIDAFRSRSRSKVDGWNVRNDFFTFTLMVLVYFRLISGVQVRVEFARQIHSDVSLSSRQSQQIARNDRSGSEIKAHEKKARY